MMRTEGSIARKKTTVSNAGLISPIRCAWALSWAKVDGIVPETWDVNLGIVRGAHRVAGGGHDADRGEHRAEEDSPLDRHLQKSIPTGIRQLMLYCNTSDG